MAVPSKLFDAWACERPVICGIEGEAQEIVAQAGGGLNIPAEDSQALKQALLDLHAHPDQGMEMGKRGHEVTSRYYARQALARRLIDTLQEVIARKKE